MSFSGRERGCTFTVAYPVPGNANKVANVEQLQIQATLCISGRYLSISLRRYLREGFAGSYDQ